MLYKQVKLKTCSSSTGCQRFQYCPHPYSQSTSNTVDPSLPMAKSLFRIAKQCATTMATIHKELAIIIATGMVCLIMMVVSLSTNYWIRMEEFMKGSFESKQAGKMYRMNSDCGLWRICYVITKVELPYEESTHDCSTIRYDDFEFGLSYHKTVQTIVTLAVSYHYKSSMPIFLAAVGFLIAAVVITIFMNSKKTLLPFFSIVCYIFSSLCIALGTLQFMGALDFEGLNDLQTESTFKTSYSYGFSFVLMGVTFLFINIVVLLDMHLWMKYRNELAELEKANIDAFTNIALQFIPRKSPLLSCESGSHTPLLQDIAPRAKVEDLCTCDHHDDDVMESPQLPSPPPIVEESESDESSWKPPLPPTNLSQRNKSNKWQQASRHAIYQNLRDKRKANAIARQIFVSRSVSLDV